MSHTDTPTFELLLVEDNPGDARLIRELLAERPERLGTFESAETVRDAIAMLTGRGRPYDAILLDLRLPDSAGVATVQAIAAAAPATPIVVLTGDTDSATAIRALQEGAQDFLVKGEHDAEGLWRAIRYAAERHGAHRRIAHLNRLLRVISEVNQLIVREIDRDRMLSQATAILVEHGGFRCAWFGLPSPEGDLVRMTAPAGLDAGQLVTLDESCQRDPADPGPTVAAASSAATVVLERVDDASRHRLFARTAAALGIASTASVPLVGRLRTLGALTVCSGRTGAFGQEELALFEELAADIAFALEAMEVDALRTRAELELRRQRDFNAAVLDTSGALVVVLDREGRIVELNRTCLELTGRSEEEVRGRRVWDLFVPEDERESVLGIFRRLVAGEFPSQAETPWLDRSGERRTIAWSNTCLTDDAGDVRYVIGTGLDITDRNRLQEQLLHAQRMEAVGRLAGGVAHDFNNLLQAIAGLQRGMERDRLDAARFAARAAELEGLIERGARLTRQLLIFSRRERPRREEVDLAATVDGAAGLVRHLLRENIRLETEMPPGPVPVLADRGQLEQVIVNLAVNAQDAMPDGGRLTIRLAGRDGTALLEVQDSGHGIPLEIADRVFEPFFTTKGADRGTGLGLAVVHDIVTGAGGGIGVESSPDGTCFRIELPLADPPGAPAGRIPEAAVELPAARNETARLLVVEDEDPVREGLVELAEALGHRVDAAPSTAVARRLAAVHEHDLLLTDLQLTDGSGLDLAKELLGRRPGLAVVLMSGYTEEAALAGADDLGIRFLEKPFGLARLREELAAALASCRDR